MITDKQIDELLSHVKTYMGDYSMQEWLAKNKGISYEDGLKYEVGFDKIHQQFIFPVRNEDGVYMDVKRFFMHDEGDWLDLADGSYTKVNLTTSIDSKNYGRKIRFSGIVIGKDLSPYIIPWLVEIECKESGGKKKCDLCALGQGPIQKQFSIEEDRDLLCNFINSSDQQVNGYIRRYMRLPNYNNCRLIEIRYPEKINIEEIRITSEINYDIIDSDYVIHKCYILAQRLKTTQQYSFWGTTWCDPKNQQGIHLIKRSKGERDNISRWALTPEIHEKLKVFAALDPQDVGSIWEKISEVHNDMSANVTNIWKRNNILMGIDLVMHSPLNFDFIGKHVNKGWAECAIIGDTRTGKTETVKKMIHHYRAGEFITSGENTTLAGLLGGLQQTHNGRWTLNWGKIVMNDRGAAVVDESDTLLEQGIMGHLTGVRSSGVAEVVKIQTQKTMARTRLIFIANPTHGKLSNYNHGVDTLWDIFGKAQDISRLDFAVFCDESTVTPAEINSRKDIFVPHSYTSELCHDRVMYAWTRTAKNIFWAPGAEDYILQAAVELGSKYSPGVPLVVSAEMRIKLAKLAISVAIMTYSTDPVGENVIVYLSHAMIAVKWLQHEYDNDISGYLEYSYMEQGNKELKDLSELERNVGTPDQVNQLILTKKIQLGDIEDIFSVDSKDARHYLSTLRKCGAIIKKNYFYVKTPAFINWLREQRRTVKEIL